MIKFPEDFVPLKKYPGYFWSDKTKSLYSIKTTGTLKQLKLNKPIRSKFLLIDDPFYSISHLGRRRFVFPHRIESYLDRSGKYVVPIWQIEMKLEIAND